MSYDSRPDTLIHAFRVGRLLADPIRELTERALWHDWSKTLPPEVAVFDEFTPRLKNLTYGSQEYKDDLEAMGEGLVHHYQENRHHPEHGELGLEWHPIRGYEGCYEVSNYGDVRSIVKDIYRKAQVTPKGYLRMQLVRDTVSKNFMVHRLVAQAFIPNPDDLPEVNHRDGNKKNNKVTNLEWVTSGDNLIHAYATGLKEPNYKYVVHCVELDITTFGTDKMAARLRELGYLNVTSSGVYGAMDRGGTHYNLTFEGSLISEYRRSRLEKMNLVDLLEMLADWKAATERMDNGSLLRSLKIQQERFGISDQLMNVLWNTANDFGWLDRAHD